MIRVTHPAARRSALPLAAILALAGCESQQTAEAPVIPPPADTSAEAPKSEIARILEENALLLPSLRKGELSFSQPADPRPVGPPTPTISRATAETPAPAPAEQPLPMVAATHESHGALAGPAAEPPAARRARLITDLVDETRKLATSADAPLTAYLALAAIEGLSSVLRPDAPEAPSALGDPRTLTRLSPREQDVLVVWRDMHRALAQGTQQSVTPAALVTGVVREAAAQMSAWSPLSITRTELCTRVDGFGTYTPIGRSKYLAGRAQKLIVYVELDNFATRPRTEEGVAGFAVELTQELSLWTESDGVLAWRKPDEAVLDFSRNRRRDFYTVQLVELPENLTVGAYRLKVTIRDRATGSQAEAILPIEVVADAKLVKASE